MTHEPRGAARSAGPSSRSPRARALSLAALLILGACSSKPEAAMPAPGLHNVVLSDAQRHNVRLYSVASATFHKTVDTTGIVDFDNDQATSVIAPFSGPVSKLLVDIGQPVKKGQALATAASADFSAALAGYAKALATAKTNRHLADLDKDLLEHHGVAQREAAQAETDAVNAESDRDAALQQLIALNVNPQAIEDLQKGRPLAHPEAAIRTPIAGTVVERLITPGQLLQAGSTAAFTIADLSRVWVMAQIFGGDKGAVNVGEGADVETGTASGHFTGRVDNVAAEVDPTTRAVAVRIVVDNPGDELKRQMYVHVRIRSSAESSALLAPVSAVLRDDENLPFVYLQNPDGSFGREHVTLGVRTDDRYEIPSGLAAGNQIVTDGGLFVQFMQNQ
jgi:cobalt-zinc-cadmium efflux system membrane fusion protein